MDLRNSNGIELRNFYFTTVKKLFRKFSSKVEKRIMWNSFRYFQIKYVKKSFYTFEDIDLRESHAKLHKNRVKL